MRGSTKKQGRDDKLLQALDWLKAKDGSFDFPTKLAAEALELGARGPADRFGDTAPHPG